MPPAFYGDEDIPDLLADLGVPVVIEGCKPMNGLRDGAGRDVLASGNVAGISATDIVVTVQTSALPKGLKNRTPLTVEGECMRLRDSLPEGDGAMTHLICERV
jgi:hypothetical protein